MEHLNRTLKDYLLGLGANVSEATIIQTSKALRNLMEVSSHFDTICSIHPESIYHTRRCYGQDLEMLVEELTVRSRVFDYVPGRFHRLFQNIKPHISDHVDVDNFLSGLGSIKLESQVKSNLRVSCIMAKCNNHLIYYIMVLNNIIRTIHDTDLYNMKSLHYIPRPSYILLTSGTFTGCLLYTSPSPRDATLSRMPSSA